MGPGGQVRTRFLSLLKYSQKKINDANDEYSLGRKVSGTEVGGEGGGSISNTADKYPAHRKHTESTGKFKADFTSPSRTKQSR